MGRLVDINDVKILINGLDSLPWDEEVDDLLKMLPTAYDVDKVVEGEWEDEQYIWKCNQCHEWLMLEDGTADMNYCPHCGAKMVGGKE